MVRTRVGYAGGKAKSPTYEQIGDHTEVVQIDFDPRRISYERLLEVFWSEHSPTSRAFSRQYRAVVLVHDAKQQRLALASKKAQAEKAGSQVHTAVEVTTTFTRAEDYHQKFYLRNHKDLLQEYQAHYPRFRDVVDSTAAARVNGFIGGHVAPGQLDREVTGLGLSSEGRQRLLAQVERRRR